MLLVNVFFHIYNNGINKGKIKNQKKSVQKNEFAEENY